MRTAVHGMPRIGRGRALKWALEGFWAGTVTSSELQETAAGIRRHNWQSMAATSVDFIPSNDFSLYDHVLDAAVMVGTIPPRFATLDRTADLDSYFAMARGTSVDGQALAPLALTKWFDTNYHHLVPEIGGVTKFVPNASKVSGELTEALALGIPTSPVLLGPLTLLLRSTSLDTGIDPLSFLEPLVGAYSEVLSELGRVGAEWIRFDEPALVEDRNADELAALSRIYRRFGDHPNRPKIALSTYFGHVGSAMQVLKDLPVEALGLDFCRGEENLALLRSSGGFPGKVLVAGVVDGRNVWANDLGASLDLLDKLAGLAAEIAVSTSCSLLHVPQGSAAEASMDEEVQPWLAFADDKLAELEVLASGAAGRGSVAEELEVNAAVFAARRNSPRVTNGAVRARVAAFAGVDPHRAQAWEERAMIQKARLALPPLPTTTIGSFPQTPELRRARASWRAGRLDTSDYESSLRAEIDRILTIQEEIGLDVFVHGEPERDDMVRYFAEQLEGFVILDGGWVQSYGSRCVRPPVLFGDVARHGPMTVDWIRYAQQGTAKPVKGMLTGPITMLRWSFVRDDRPEHETAEQLALAIRDELTDLQEAGTGIIQVDEPALREGLPLRSDERLEYLAWASRVFRLVTSAAGGGTQVHTHMCYAELEDIVAALGELDIDVVSFEASRSDMAVIDVLRHSAYPGGAGPGIYDVHSPMIPDVAALEDLIRRALDGLGADRLWVNPDCGLKTRRYGQVLPALDHMVKAARGLRKEVVSGEASPDADAETVQVETSTGP